VLERIEQPAWPEHTQTAAGLVSTIWKLCQTPPVTSLTKRYVAHPCQLILGKITRHIALKAVVASCVDAKQIIRQHCVTGSDAAASCLNLFPPGFAK
jgi:hypothetical protein